MPMEPRAGTSNPGRLKDFNVCVIQKLPDCFTFLRAVCRFVWYEAADTLFILKYLAALFRKAAERDMFITSQLQSKTCV